MRDRNRDSSVVHKGARASLVRWRAAGESFVAELVTGRYVGKTEVYWQLEQDGQLTGWPRDEWQLCIA